MIKKKYLMILSIAVVSVLFGSLFVGNVLLAQSSGEYDPWIDINEDGIIDVNDLASMGQTYGTSGDPTKNVNVTNWPEPQKELFPETLVLRGAKYSYYYRKGFPPHGFLWEEWTVLIDENTPYPPLAENYTYLGHILKTDVKDVWEGPRVLNFTHEVYPQTTYQIQGDVILRPTMKFSCTNDDLSLCYFYFNITVYFEKIDANNVPTVLASDTLKVDFRVNVASVYNHTAEDMGFTFKFPEPVGIEGERLRIRFETLILKTQQEADAKAELWHTRGTDEFIAHVPIYQP